MKPLRSILYSPGHKREMIEKAPNYGADAICIVLEDSVPDDRKDEARAITAEGIATLAAAGETVIVKVNEVDSDELERDLAAIAIPGLAGIILPKSQAPAQLRHVDELLTHAERANGAEPESVEVIVLIETPLAAVRAFELASTLPRVHTLAVGTAANGDMARGLGFRWTPGGMERLYLRSKVVMDARAAGCAPPLDGIWGDMRDMDGLVREAEVARELGYFGKLVVHPKHVELVNRVFTPSEQELEVQRRVVEAFDVALAEGSAAVVVDGQFIDYAMASTARDLLALAERIGPRPA
jgi:citrate lyase subunit beta/citryl-CoA lyase